MDGALPKPVGLQRHEAALARDLELLQLPPANWPARVAGPDGQPMLDVAVIGAGMYGIAAAAALVFKGIRHLRLLDRAPAGREGPWVTYARMPTLRSPKQLPGIALGIPALTFRAWYEAQHGPLGWEALYKIGNADWQAYLLWVRSVLDLPIENEVEVLRVVPAADHVALHLAGGVVTYARRVVVATGRPGLGGAAIPDWIDPTLFPDRAAHTMDAIDFAALAGRRVAVIGAGASAWDNAATALEAGAGEVAMFARRPVLPQINKGRGTAGPAFFEGWAALDPADRWAISVYKEDLQAPPPHETVHRTIAHGNFQLHLGSPVLAARPEGAGVALQLRDRVERVDFLIVGTGFAVDLAREKMFGPLPPKIATWADRYTPPPELQRPDLGRYPWLGEGFELEEKVPGSVPGLDRLHLFSHGALLSLGAIASDVPGASAGAERLAHAVVGHFMREDLPAIRQALEAFDEPELEGTPFFVPAGER
jgi:cation diffusion facilitator CzcD-associated flavoprotein CzcO